MPRIIIPERTFKAVFEDHRLVGSSNTPKYEFNYIQDMLRQGDDGLCFIDCFRAFEFELNGPESYLDYLVKHRGIIVGSDVHQAEISSPGFKYRWLAQYHNCVVEKLSEEFFHQ